MAKATAQVGYTIKGVERYKTWCTPAAVGVDVTVRDGLGNVIEVSAREGSNGYRISLNGKTIKLGGEIGIAWATRKEKHDH